MGQHPVFPVGVGIVLGKHRKFLPSQCGGQPWDSVGSLPSLQSQLQGVQNGSTPQSTDCKSIISYNWPSEVTSRQQVWSSQSHSPAHHPVERALLHTSAILRAHRPGGPGNGTAHLDHHLAPSSQAPLDKGTKLMSRALKGLKPLCMTPAEKASGQKKGGF